MTTAEVESVIHGHHIAFHSSAMKRSRKKCRRKFSCSFSKAIEHRDRLSLLAGQARP